MQVKLVNIRFIVGDHMGVSACVGVCIHVYVYVCMCVFVCFCIFCILFVLKHKKVITPIIDVEWLLHNWSKNCKWKWQELDIEIDPTS